MTTLNLTPDTHWLDVLSGHAAPTDHDSRQAAQLREYFALRDTDENAHPLDAACQARMLSHLQSRLPPDAPTSLQAKLVGVLDWLLPAGAANGPRYALAAGLAVAAVAVPMLMQHNGAADDEAMPKGQIQHPEARLQVVLDPHPQNEAQQLVQALGSVGVNAQLSPQGEAWRVQTQVTPAQFDRAQTRLLNWGVLLPANGELEVEFRPVN